MFENDGTFYESSGRRVPRLRCLWQPDWRWSYRCDVEQYTYTDMNDWRRYGDTRIVTRRFWRLGPLWIEWVALKWRRAS